MLKPILSDQSFIDVPILVFELFNFDVEFSSFPSWKFHFINALHKGSGKLEGRLEFDHNDVSCWIDDLYGLLMDLSWQEIDLDFKFAQGQ